MGFGHIFIGFFFLIFFPISRLGLLLNISLIGCLFMLSGLKRLAFYCKDKPQFKKALVPLGFLSILSVFSLAIDAAELGGVLEGEIAGYANAAVNALYSLIICIFALFLLNGIGKLAKEVGLPAISKRTVRVASVTVLYGAVEILSCIFSLILAFSGISSPVFTAVTAYMGLSAFLLSYISIFLNLALIFTCYMRICLEGDEDMPYREDIFDKIVSATTRKNK